MKDYAGDKYIDLASLLDIFLMIWVNTRAKLDMETKNEIAIDGISGVSVPVGPPLTHRITNTNIGSVFSNKIAIVHIC